MGESKKKSMQAKDVCPDCSSANVFLARYRWFESVVASFLPSNVFRCLDCNKRFWAYEPLFSNASRVWALIFSSVAVLVIVFIFFQPDDSQTNLSRKAEFIPQFDSSPTSLSVSDESSSSEDLSLDEPIKTEQLAAVLSSTDTAQVLDLPLLDNTENNADRVAVTAQPQDISNTVKSSINRLESAVFEDKEALVSLLKIDINHVIESWRKAWQSGAAKDYLSYYSDRFRPSNFLPIERWKTQRESRVRPDNKIELTLTDFNVSFVDENKRAVAEFTQSYFSTTFAEVSRKRLEFVNEKDEWKIISEREIK